MGDPRERIPKPRPVVTPTLVGMTELTAAGSVTDSSEPQITRDNLAERIFYK